jgi:hypothetical protein
MFRQDSAGQGRSDAAERFDTLAVCPVAHVLYGIDGQEKRITVTVRLTAVDARADWVYATDRARQVVMVIRGTTALPREHQPVTFRPPSCRYR